MQDDPSEKIDPKLHELADVLLNQLKTPILYIDSTGIITFCNEATESTFSLSCHEILDRTIEDAFPGMEVEDRLETGITEVLQTEGYFEGSGINVNKDGHRLSFFLSANQVTLDHGLKGWVAEFRDISSDDEELIYTESITQQFLAVASDLGRYITEGLPLHTLLDRILNSMILHLDLIGGAIHLIDSTRTTADLEVQRNLSGPFLDSIRKMSLELGFLQTLIEDGKPTLLVEILDSRLTFYNMLRDNDYHHAISMPLSYKDTLVGIITLIPRETFSENERNLLESIGNQLALSIGNTLLVRDLRESQRKYSTVVERANDGIMISQDGVFKLVNKPLADMLEYSVSEMIGMEIKNVLAPGDEKEIMRHYKARIQGTVPREIYLGRLKNKAGKIVQVEFNACTIQYEGKTASLSFVRNITRRIALQDQVVAQKEMAEFYNDVLTHDINNFCQAMLGNLDELLSDVDGRADPLRFKRLNACKNSILKISHIIDRIRELMHIQTIEPESLFPLSLSDLIAEGIEITHESFPQEKFRIRSDIPKEAYILGNNLIILIVINLLSNAIKHNDKAEQQVEISVEQVELVERPAWKILFADNGPGISSEISDKIFERFQRFSKRKGKGLGLSIVRALVDKLSGTIQVEQQVNAMGGVTISVILPQA